MATIKTFIVDDSAVVRQVLSDALAKDRNIEIIGVASDPIYALEKFKSQWPDVIVLDVEMPRMDGISFLKKLMSEAPTPVVICSTLTEKGAKTSIEALEAGAVSIVTKPRSGLKNFLEKESRVIIAAVKEAAAARVGKLRPLAATDKPLAMTPHPVTSQDTAMSSTTDRLVAIGTSTGGTQALERVLSCLPRVSPGLVIVQHMPEKFTAAFAKRLNSLCEIEVKEAEHRDRVIPGRALIAPGGRHMRLKRNGAQYIVEVIDGPPVNRHTPSVDVLFKSTAKAAGANALGIIMTGMGEDGAGGLLEMKNHAAHTIAQDEASCVVFGMPREAIKRNAASSVVTLSAIPQAIMDWY